MVPTAMTTDQKRVNYGMEGGIVAHAHGVTLSQSLGETSALVEAPGANGVTISNQTGVKTDFRGYTVVPYVTPYRETAVSLDTETLPDGADVDLTSQMITPTRGAIVRAHFDTRIGKRVLMNLSRTPTGMVPFGALVTIEGQPADKSFIVGDHGQVYLTGAPERGTLKVTWGRTANDTCHVTFNLTELNATDGVMETQESCR